MTPEIKQRMAQIRRGEVPEGYKNTPVGVIPSNWKIQPLGMSCLIADGMHQTPQYTSQGVPFVSVENIGRIDGTNKFISRDAFDKFKIKPRENDIFMTRITAGIIGETEIIRASTPLAYYVSLALIRIIAPEEIDVIFLNHFINCHIFKKELYKRIIHTAFPKKINLNEIGECVTVIPPLGEQQKVASILTTQDKVIELKEKRLAEKHRQKKHLMQQLLTGKKRLPGFYEAWSFPKARELFQSVSDKDHNGDLAVLSSTQNRGIVPRVEVDIDIKYDTSSLINYKKVSKGNFVISLRSFQGGIEYSTYTGLVSPAYTVLASRKEISDEYYKQFFKSADYINRLNVAVYGIRDGKQISYEDFGRLRIPYPPIKEQDAIAEVLSTADHEIDLLQQDIEQEKQKKKALMQLLLTGIVRVEV